MILWLILLLFAPIPEYLYPEKYPIGTKLILSYEDLTVYAIKWENGQKMYFMKTDYGRYFKVGWTEDEVRNGLTLWKWSGDY